MDWLRILAGDCGEILPALEAGSVQCCVTSPPYWGLRDYGTAQWEGGEAGCEHKQERSLDSSRLRNDGRVHIGPYDGEKALSIGAPYREVCGKCGARRIDSQLGLEATPGEYIANMVAVFREVWRVLRLDGTVWLNLGDSYCSTDKWGGGVGGNNGKHTVAEDGSVPSWAVRSKRAPIPGLKPKDLCMLPARLALALQAGFSACDECGHELRNDLWPAWNGHRVCFNCRRSEIIPSHPGWYLRSEIVWHKPNPMPESVTDRPTKAHEMIYLLAKQERYYYDATAIKEPSIYVGPQQSQKRGEFNGKTESMIGLNAFRAVTESRNKRSVWTIATQPYAEAHFATFPEEIPKLCILAGTGTVGQVALELGRRAVLIELNPAYVKLARGRTNVTPGFFNWATPSAVPPDRPGVEVELEI